MRESATSHLPNVGAGPGKGLNITLWCVQVLLALAFLGASSVQLMDSPRWSGSSRRSASDSGFGT